MRPVSLPARNAGTSRRGFDAGGRKTTELVVGNDSSSDSTVGEGRSAARVGSGDPRLRIEDYRRGVGLLLLERTDSRRWGAWT